MTDENVQQDIPHHVPLYDINHPYLRVPLRRGMNQQRQQEIQAKLTTMQQYPVYAPSGIDWGFLTEIIPHDTRFESRAAELEEMLEVNFGTFICRAWDRLFSINEPIYIEATYEFYSSFAFNHANPDPDAKTVSFLLGGEFRKLSLKEFGEDLGLFDEADLAHPDFGDFMVSVIKTPTYSENAAIWSTIANEILTTERAPSYTQIRDPNVRAIFSMVCLFGIGRKSGIEKCYKEELFWLGCIVKKRVVNVPYILARWMTQILKGARPGSVIRGGHFVTVIGKHLKVRGAGFDRCTTLTPEMRLLGSAWFKSAGIVIRFVAPGNHVTYRWAEIKRADGGRAVVEL